VADDDDLLSEDEVVQLLGRERFVRLAWQGYLAPQGRRQGRPFWSKDYVDFRYREDLRLQPPRRAPAVLTKDYGRPVAVGRNQAGRVVELIVRDTLPTAQPRPLPAAVVAEFQALRRLFGRFGSPGR
jgi:hypothetical protein